MHSYDANALATVVYQFFGGLDRRDHQTTAELMAREGTWERQGARLVGPQAVLEALAQRDPRRQTAHLVTNLWVEQATPTSARLRFYMTAYETSDSAGQAKMLGVRDCTDDLVLEDGHWRIQWKKSHLFMPAQ